MSKYLVNHFDITPENFKKYNYLDRKVKSLYVSNLGSSVPSILYDVAVKSKNAIFSSADTLVFIPLNQYCHMYVSAIAQVSIIDHNLVATALLRTALLNFAGASTMQTISGDVLIFGSMSSFDSMTYEVDYSVPYEIVEQVARLHEVYVSV